MPESEAGGAPVGAELLPRERYLPLLARSAAAEPTELRVSGSGSAAAAGCFVSGSRGWRRRRRSETRSRSGRSAVATRLTAPPVSSSALDPALDEQRGRDRGHPAVPVPHLAAGR